MFGLLGSLTKAAVGVVIETPIAIVADAVTLGGTLTDKDEPYTATSVKRYGLMIKCLLFKILAL